MGNIEQHHCVPKLMTQSQTTDAFTEHVLTLPGNGMVRYTLFKSTGYNLIVYIDVLEILQMIDCDRMFLV